MESTWHLTIRLTEDAVTASDGDTVNDLGIDPGLFRAALTGSSATVVDVELESATVLLTPFREYLREIDRDQPPASVVVDVAALGQDVDRTAPDSVLAALGIDPA